MTYEQGKRYLVTRNGVQFAATYDNVFFISDIDGCYFTIGADEVATPLTGLRAMKVGDVVVPETGQSFIVKAITNNHTAFMDVDGKCWTFENAEEYGWTLQDQPEEMTLEEISKALGKKVVVKDA